MSSPQDLKRSVRSFLLGPLLLSYFLVVVLLIINIEYDDTLSTISLIPEINYSKRSRRETGQFAGGTSRSMLDSFKGTHIKKKRSQNVH